MPTETQEDLKSSWKYLLVFAIPLLAVIFDFSLRFSDMKQWSAPGWGVYALSVIISAGIWQLLAFALHFLRRRSKIAGAVFLVLVTPGLAFVFIAAWRAYFYFDFMPNYFVIDYMFTEAYHFWRIVQEYLPPILGIMVIIALAMSALLWIASGDQMRGIFRKKYLIIAGAALWAAAVMVYNNNLRIFDQSSLPDVNFFLVAGQIGYNRLTGGQAGTSAFKHRIIPQLEHVNREPEFNVLVMINENLRPDHLTIYGYKRETSPELQAFIDRHKGEVLIFENAQAHATTTQLSIPTILQGLNPSILGEFWHSSPVVFEYAKMMNNVRTFFISSQRWHWQNYDLFIQSSALDFVWSQDIAGLPLYNDIGIDDHLMIAEFIHHLAEISSKPGPFLGVINFNGTHDPYRTPQEFKKWTGREIDQYDCSILYLDTAFGTAFKFLEQKGILDHTIIIFTSDHAVAFNEHGHKGHHHFYRENIHVPFWIYIPKSLQGNIAGIENLRDNASKAFGNQDITPTILDLYGLYDLPSLSQFRDLMQGGSLLRKIDESRPVYSLSQTDIARITENPGLSMIVNGKKYLIEIVNYKGVERLFDIYQDPLENHDLWPALSEEERDKYRKLALAHPNTSAIYKKTVQRNK